MLCDNCARLDLHDHSCGSARLAVLWWLAEVVPEQIGSGQPPKSFTIVTGWGKSREYSQMADVRAAVLNLLASCTILCNIHPTNSGLVQLNLSEVNATKLRAFFS